MDLNSMLKTPEYVTVAPQGDLTVAIGNDSAQKLTKISSDIIKIASPVFRVMLGSSFKEGQTTYDESNPLKLPDDDPTSMLNLFHILHWNGDNVDQKEKDWIQKLVALCDKYECAERIKIFVNYHANQTPQSMRLLSDPKNQRQQVSVLDRLIMSALVGDKDGFELQSEKVARTPKAILANTSHKELMQLAPEGMLDGMMEYRRQARAQYRDIAHEFTLLLFKSDEVKNFTLCPGLQKRFAIFNETLVARNILFEASADDAELPDMELIFCSPPFGDFDTSYEPPKDPDIDEYRCPQSSCESCDVRVGMLAFRVVESLLLGSKEHCVVCFECFKAREFKFRYQCETHNPWWATD